MVNTGMELLVGFIEGIANNMDTVTATAVTILTTILNGILDHAPELIVAGLTLILNLIAGLIQSIPQIISTVAELIQALWDTFFTVDWSSVGSAIVQGIWNGITGLWDSMVSWVKGKVSAMWGEVKSELGIASPSKKFKYIGEMSVEGMIEGFKDEETDLDRTVTTLYTGMLDTANLGAQMVSRNGMEQVASGAFQLPATGTDGGINSLAQMVSDGFQSVSGRSSGVHTAILNVNGRQFCRAIFEDQQIVTNDHGMSLIVT
jgi:phage-related protein